MLQTTNHQEGSCPRFGPARHLVQLDRDWVRRKKRVARLEPSDRPASVVLAESLALA